MTTWKDKTCERCWFRVDAKCRRFPPSITNSHFRKAGYPAVLEKSAIDGSNFASFNLACSEYGETQQAEKPEEEDLFSQGQRGKG